MTSPNPAIFTDAIRRRFEMPQKARISHPSKLNWLRWLLREVEK